MSHIAETLGNLKGMIYSVHHDELRLCISKQEINILGVFCLPLLHTLYW